ncbi:hypothetical protein Pla22_25390 [Rubripirellula amarantea]|uniref:Uncharacterized protein n=1 Tax=Rubripirellula amarantea TaxID=2527999 RepID=A0A5C5WYA7_9BACT|nr:hypothetical protein Pla22_25390 [Rubripirellula amarantea]
MNTSSQFAFIQTNHGVTFPLVGPDRVKQSDLHERLSEPVTQTFSSAATSVNQSQTSAPILED